MRSEVNWYICANREEMLRLIMAGFDYKNFRREKWNDGNPVYYFERTLDFQEYLNMSGIGYHNAKRKEYYDRKNEKNRSNE